jgi:hypothetical protein
MSRNVVTKVRNIETIKADILNAKGYCSVVFVKADGSMRRMTVRRGDKSKVILGSELGDKMSESFSNNPKNSHLLKSYDETAAARYAHECRLSGITIDPAILRTFWRTINLKTTLTVAANRQFIRYV